MSIPQPKYFDHIQVVGGPLDGQELPNNDSYYKEGELADLNTIQLCRPDLPWRKESVYRVTGGKLVYDEALTLARPVKPVVVSLIG
jgi:hypothetical protein